MVVGLEGVPEWGGGGGGVVLVVDAGECLGYV